MGALALLTGLMVVIASGCGATKMAASTGGHGASTARSGGAIAARAAGIDPMLINSFAILRRPVQPEDQLPPTFLTASARRLQHPGLSTTRLRGMGLLPALARGASIPGTKLEEWLEPGRHGYCVWTAERTTSGTFVTGGFGSVCGTTATITTRLSASVGGGASLAAGPTITPGARGGPALVNGIVPDRVSSIVLVARNGLTIPLKTAEGFFATRFSPGDRLYAVIAGRRYPISAP